MKMICMLILCIFFAQGVSAQGVKFEDCTLEQALKKAKKTKKKVFIDCMTDKCIPCLRVAKQIFPTKVCGDYFNKNFVCMQVNLDKHPDGRALYERFKITSVPTFIVLTADDELCGIRTGVGGVTNGDDMVNAIKDAISTWTDMEKATEEYAQNKNDYAVMLKYIKLLKASKRPGQIPGILKEYYENKKNFGWFSPECWKLFNEFLSDIRHPLYREFFNIRWKYVINMGEYKVYEKFLERYRPIYKQRYALNPEVMKLAISDLYQLEQEGVEEAHWLRIGLELRMIISNKDESRYDEVVSIFQNQVYKCPDVMWRIQTYKELDAFRKLDSQRAKSLNQMFKQHLGKAYFEFKTISDMRDSCAPLAPIGVKALDEYMKKKKEQQQEKQEQQY